jgi:two-component system, LuxR family, sensor kinase FixL
MRLSIGRGIGMEFPKVLSWRAPVVGTIYLLGYVGLDWLSYVEPFGRYAITPWNPPPGLSFVLILLFGQRFLPLLFAAPLLAEVFVRGLPAPLWVEATQTFVFGFGYSTATVFLLRPRRRLDVTLSSMRDLITLLVTAAASAALITLGFMCLLWAAGLLASHDFPRAALRHWIGDFIGIAVVTPFLLILLTRGRLLELTWEILYQALTVVLLLFLVFLDAQFFYLLFLPVVWIAVRSGLEGVATALFVIQLGTIATVHLTPHSIDLTSLQGTMLVLAMTGLAAGVLVTERRRAELQLRIQQDAQARITRIGSMGELAASLAHEINQPLMAAGTYARIAVEGLDHGEPITAVTDAAHKALGQIDRAAQVLRGLRDFIRLGRSEVAPIAVQPAIEEILELMQAELDRGRVNVRTQFAPTLPAVMADTMQIGQVVMNLVRNAAEAIEGAHQTHGLITIEAHPDNTGKNIQISVTDTGPGFPVGKLSSSPTLFSTTKSDGLGIGLSLSRSIVEAHGGRLWIAESSVGGDVRFTLPVAEAGHE